MRLDLEPNPSQIVYSESASTGMFTEDNAAEAANFLREGIKAAQTGNRVSARTSLLRAAELDPRNESAWLWLSSISEYPEELLVFLTNVLEINPLNARALEWSAATRSLLAKNFVQRGIDAAESGQPDMAAQHFGQALEYDERNSMAWLWLASLAESNDGKLTYLEKVLEFDPTNEAAKAGLESARNAIRTGLLGEARAAAVAGKTEEADALLDAIVAEEPDAEDAWVLRSHLAKDFASKASAFQRILEINPDNAAAKAGLESLTLIMDAVSGAEKSVQSPAAVPEAYEQLAESVEETSDADFADDKPANAEFIDEQPAVDNSLAERDSAADNSFDAAPSPFDSFADNSFAANDGTIEVQTADAWDQGEEMCVPGPTSVENVFEGEFPAATSAFESPAPESVEADQWTGSENGNVVFTVQESTDVSTEPTGSFDPEPIVYELAPETEEESCASDPQAEAMTDPVEWTIPEPTVNPFDGVSASDEADQFKTILSVDLDEEMRAAVENYDPEFPVAEERPTASEAFNVPFDMTMYGGQFIPMPADDLDQAVPDFQQSYETRLVNVPAELVPASVANTCPFCGHDNDMQVISCNSCLAVLTLADLELILANSHADKNTLRLTVSEMEREKAERELSEAELTTLGIGHLNLRNLESGYQILHEASQKNPDNVVLSGQVNSLLIRLEEIKQQDATHLTMSRGKTILVVDDSPTVRKLIAGKLEKCGHEVFCSADGVEAMEALETLKPDLILLDITMPRMDGYQVCKLIRGNETLKDVPVVMISGKDGFFDKVRGRMAGTSGYITKPFGPETLMKAVESYLRAEA